MTVLDLLPIVATIVLAYGLGTCNGIDTVLRRLSLGSKYWKHQLHLYELKAKHEEEMREAADARD